MSKDNDIEKRHEAYDIGEACEIRDVVWKGYERKIISCSIMAKRFDSQLCDTPIKKCRW